MLALLETGLQPVVPFNPYTTMKEGLTKTPISHLVPREIPKGKTLTHAQISELTEVQRLTLRHAEERAAMEAQRARAAEQAAERHLQKAELAARHGDAMAARDSLRRARGTLIDVASGLNAAKSDSRIAPTRAAKLIEQRIEARARQVERIVQQVEQFALEAESRDEKAGIIGRVGPSPSLSIMI
jgi:hypothetical protein